MGNFLRLNLFIFFVDYFCLQNKLLMLMAVSLFCLLLGSGWVLGSLLIGNTYDFQLFNLSVIWKIPILTVWCLCSIDGIGLRDKGHWRFYVCWQLCLRDQSGQYLNTIPVMLVLLLYIISNNTQAGICNKYLFWLNQNRRKMLFVN